jgi:hypothetical protein
VINRKRKEVGSSRPLYQDGRIGMTVETAKEARAADVGAATTDQEALQAIRRSLPTHLAPGRTPMEWTILLNEGGAINALGKTGAIEIEIIANMMCIGNTITLDGLHFTKNAGRALGPKQLREFGRDFLRQHGHGATELVINPAPRTTGATAGTGVAPKLLTIKLE